MRLLPVVALSLASVISLRADGDVPVVVTPIADQSLTIGQTQVTIDLSTHFTLPGVTGQIVQIATSEGNIFAELLPTAAPNTVTNFLSYVTGKSYNNSFIHRAESGFVVQGGGYKADANLNVTAVAAKPAVNNEYNLPNTRGTLAMAKVDGNPNSATNQWFFNLVDNSTTLGTANNGGFTVFARVLGNGMGVVDIIAALPQFSGLSAPFDHLPLAHLLPSQNQIHSVNLVEVSSVSSGIPLYPSSKGKASVLAFSILNTNPGVVAATLKGVTLTLISGKVAGTSQVTIQDLNGNFDDVTFTVTVASAVDVNPKNQMVVAGQSAVFDITAGPDGSAYEWQRRGAGTTDWISLSDTPPFSGTNTTSLTVGPTTSAMNGDSFQCLVTTDGITTTRIGATLTVVPPPLSPQPALQTFASGPVSIDLSGGTPGGLTYYASGLPKGLTLDSATGQITGTITAKIGTYTVTYWSQNGTLKSEVKTMTFVVNAFPATMPSSYETMLVDGDGLPVGKIELDVTSTGAFTGRLTCADVQVYSLRGQLTLTSNFDVGVITLPLIRSAHPDEPFSLILNVVSNTTIVAQLDAGSTPATVGTTPNTSTVIVPTKAKGAPWIGTYTLLLGDPQNLDSSPLDAAVTPSGIGYATVKIATNGQMSLTGKTADGSPFTASLASSYGTTYGSGYLATYRAYIKPYKTAEGYLAGWIYMIPRSDSTTDKPVYEAGSTGSSDFYWSKPANAADKTYPMGFGPVGFSITIEPWNKAVSLAGTFPLTVDQAGLSNAGGNSDQLPVNLTFDAKYVDSLAAPSDLSNPSDWTFKVTTSTGAFTGSFTVQRTVNGKATSLKVPFEGVLQQLASPASATPFAQGYFLLPPSDGAGTSTRSGLIQLSTP